MSPTDGAGREPTLRSLSAVLEPEEVAAAALDGIRDERFLILPHPDVQQHAVRRASDHDRWLRGMRRLRAEVMAKKAGGL